MGALVLVLGFACVIFLQPTCIVADFHIVEYAADGKFYIVPSNKYKCSSINHFGVVSVETKTAVDTAGGNFNTAFFQSEGDTCGVNGMDFYRRDGHYWEGYQHNGSGEKIATCYKNTDGQSTINCPSVNYMQDERVFFGYEKVVCYSSLCES